MALIAVCWHGTVTAAGSLDQGLAAWRAGDRTAALATWHELAAAGDAEASLFLGYLYRNGTGVARDEVAAFAWYRQAAERGLPEAQYELALMYELGLGVAPDDNEAAFWYGLSSAQACPGELRADGRLGVR